METWPPGGGSPALAADQWRLIAPGHAWNELVLPDRQRESLRAIADGLPTQGNGGGRSGANAPGQLVLFAGPVGTGKSMAARIIGAQLRMPILEVDASALRASDRSGLEQTIGRVFATARAENAILFFEHADEVLSERPLPSARHPRHGTLTAPDLFDRAERHAGLVIFASTLRGKIDPAYRTRFSSVIEFPFPDREARERIWRQLLPPDARLTQSDIEDLASSFQLPGATIAGCVLTAVAAADEQDASVTLLHVAEAVQAEYRRRLASESTLRAVAALIARAREAHAESSHPRDLDRGARNGVPLAPGPIGAGSPPASGSIGAGSPPGPSPTRVGPTRAPRRTSSPGRTRYGLLSAGALVAAVAIGFGAAELAASPAPAGPSQAAAGPVQVTLPAGWRQVRGKNQGLTLANELTVEPRNSPQVHLTIGTLPPGDPALLPRPMLASLHSVPPAQIAMLGSLSFYRYPNLLRVGNGESESVYATPTTIGTLLGVCTAPPADARAAGECERVLSTVRLASGTVLGTASGVSYANSLNAVIGRLNALRARVGAQLASARTASSQSQAASQLAAAHAEAALAVGKLKPGLAGAVNSQLAAALQSSAAAYSALAVAAQRHDARAYAGARTSVTSAQAALSSAMAQLSALGYRIG